jgi:NADPH2:quinone reductase
MNPFWALRIHESNGQPYAKLEQMTVNELSAGDVTIETHYSSINYEDALAGTGKGKILKSFPLNAGIDAAGVVLESANAKFKPGDKVLVTGCGIGESFDGGYAEILRVNSDSVIPLPNGLTLRESMILGTAGFTAALALHRMEANGQTPQKGPILITGASGGVGSFATQIFSHRGYEVHAVSGKHEAHAYLKMLGAVEVIRPEDLNLGQRPLEKTRYGGAVDNVGGEVLSHLLAHIGLWGNVASIGMAASAELHATVMPFILRGVSLLGSSSNNCTVELRHEIWKKLAGPWKPAQLEKILTKTVELKDLTLAFEDLINRKAHGRILVQIRRNE